MITNDSCSSGNMGGFLALCYHYVRPKDDDCFPDLLGTGEDIFKEHIHMLKQNYQIVNLQDVCRFYSGHTVPISNMTGLLLTFDDGLADHYLAASVLAKQGLSGVFFIPTCILMDKLPPNPTIIHYCLAKYRLDRFLAAYRDALEECGLSVDDYHIRFNKGLDDPWLTIATIKWNFKYRLNYKIARRILLHIYNRLLLRDYPNALEMMHLTNHQIHDMLNMGHFIGVHSHSHLSVAASQLSESDFLIEMIKPKEYLQSEFGVSVNSLSYPFGEKNDCLSAKELIIKTSGYELAFTVEKILNTKETSTLELGRYMPNSKDTADDLKSILNAIGEVKGEPI